MTFNLLNEILYFFFIRYAKADTKMYHSMIHTYTNSRRMHTYISYRVANISCSTRIFRILHFCWFFAVTGFIL